MKETTMVSAAGILWPKNLKPESTGTIRLGRVVHWFFAFVASAIVLGGIYWVAFAGGGLFVAAAVNGGLALCTLLIGRSFRYILSGE